LYGADASLDDEKAADAVPSEPPLVVGVPLSDVPVARRSPLEWLPIAGLAGAALLGQTWAVQGRLAAEDHLAQMERLTAEALPSAVDGWQRTDFQVIERPQRDPQGKRSLTWLYGHGDVERTMIVSVDYPFPGWHELPMCYRGVGWRVAERRIVGGHGKPYVVRTVLKDGAGAPAYLWFAAVDASGQTLEPPQQNWTATVRNQLRIALNRFGTDTTTRQVQLFLPAGREMTMEEIELIEQRFTELIPRMAPNLLRDTSDASERKGPSP
jgi:hypothetical protein